MAAAKVLHVQRINNKEQKGNIEVKLPPMSEVRRGIDCALLGVVPVIGFEDKVKKPVKVVYGESGRSINKRLKNQKFELERKKGISCRSVAKRKNGV